MLLRMVELDRSSSFWSSINSDNMPWQFLLWLYTELFGLVFVCRFHTPGIDHGDTMRRSRFPKRGTFVSGVFWDCKILGMCSAWQVWCTQKISPLTTANLDVSVLAALSLEGIKLHICYCDSIKDLFRCSLFDSIARIFLRDRTDDFFARPKKIRDVTLGI